VEVALAINQLRPIGIALLAALVAATAVPIGVSAFNGVAMIEMPDQVVTRTTALHPCTWDAGQLCYEVMRMGVPRHVVFTDSSKSILPTTQARACGTYYTYPWTEYDAYSGLGQELYWVRIDSEDGYDGCSTAWNVYVSPNCGIPAGSQWTCGTYTKGAFWDGGKNANTDWQNRATSIHNQLANEDDCTYNRTWTDVYGNVTYQNWNDTYKSPC